MSLFHNSSKKLRYQEWKRENKVYQAARLRKTRDRLYWLKFFSYLRHYKGALAWILVLIFAGGAVGLVLPFMSRFVLDYVVRKRDFALLNWIIAIGLGVYLIHAACSYFQQRLVVTFSLDLVTKIRKDLFAHQLKLPLSFFEKNSPGKLISKLTYSIMTIKILVETFAYVCLKELVAISMLFTAALVIDWRLTLILACLLPVFGLYIVRLNHYMARVAVLLQTKNDQIVKTLDRAFHSVKLFQIFGKGPEEVEKFGEIMEQDKKYRIKRTMVYAVNSILINLFSSLVVLAALWYGGRQIILKQLSYGEVLAYIICLGMVFRPLSELVRASAYLQAGKIGIRAVFSVMENTSPIQDPAFPVTPKTRDGKVEFRNVWFHYGKGKGGLKRANFTIEPGQTALIIGHTGAGKSTIFNLLLRLYECERGSVFIDGVNARRMKLDDLRGYFSVVTQDQMHLEDTVLNNILFATENSREDVWEAPLEKVLKLGNEMEMNPFITSLEKRFGQKIGATGLNLSRGELQKIALMRAAARDAPIVLMDEPTASLDHRSEQKITEIIQDQFQGKTVLIISHRPLPLLKPDRILILKNGYIEAQGDHEFLLQNSRYYRQLLRVGPDLSAA